MSVLPTKLPSGFMCLPPGESDIQIRFNLPPVQSDPAILVGHGAVDVEVVDFSTYVHNFVKLLGSQNRREAWRRQ